MSVETCHLCGSLRVILVKIRISNGAYHFAWWCKECNRNARGGGIWIPHSHIPDPSIIPLLEDYAAKFSDPCAVCGKRDGTELHHFAPKHIFGEYIAEMWPKLYLCKTCHDYWHGQIAAHRETDCKYCKGLTLKNSAQVE